MVQLKGVSKHYSSVVALDKVDLSIRKGEFLTFLGSSGSGKTTLLNLISGTAFATSGRIVIDGKDVTDMPPSQRGLGMVFQSYALFPHMTVYENIAFPLRVRRMKEQEIRSKVMTALELVRLPEMAQRKPKQLSGGQQQRIAIARCLVYDPELVLMDEPLGALDKKLREQLQIEIKRLHATLGMTILYVTHDQEEALVMSDRICLMRNGRIEQLGSARELYFTPRTIYTADFLGESNLLNVTLQPTKDGVRVLAAGGLEIRLPAGAGFPSRPVKMMIRPEKLTLLGAEEMAPNVADGVIEDVVFVGGITNFRVRIADGVFLTAKCLTRRLQFAVTPGIPARVGWSNDDAILLES
jgi:putative spermidine/putrescine transport system ATP-binding protein